MAVVVTIVVDYREASIIRWMESREDINMRTSSLPIGDIVFEVDGSPFLLIERKTLEDLHSSIVQDGRYKEQKIRIMNSDIPRKCYIIEGYLQTKSTNQWFEESDRDRLYSAIIHTTFRDDIPVLRTENVLDTLQTLYKIYMAIISGKIPIQTKTGSRSESGSITEYVQSLVKKTKKENLTPDICFQLQLAQIPGVSIHFAKAIAEQYPNFSKLIQAFVTHGERILEPITVPNQKRKLGKVLSKRIHDFLLHNTEGVQRNIRKNDGKILSK